jgi:hypothetical protein
MVGDYHVGSIFFVFSPSFDFHKPGRHYLGIERGPEAGIVMQELEMFIKRNSEKPNGKRDDEKNGESYGHDNKYVGG